MGAHGKVDRALDLKSEGLGFDSQIKRHTKYKVITSSITTQSFNAVDPRINFYCRKPIPKIFEKNNIFAAISLVHICIYVHIYIYIYSPANKVNIQYTLS